MGIDIHAFNFIKYQASRRSLGSVLTIGRQSLCVEPYFVEKNLGAKKPIEQTGYCEPLLLALGADSVKSIDFSDYEGASFSADLNHPISIKDKFHTVIDSGSLEHIFDAANAFKNTVKLCEEGGVIIHILPVNNLNGHGFWQFSSDLIYSIYSPINGFTDTEVYYASSLNPTYWYRIPIAKPGERIEIVSIEPIILLSVSRKLKDVEKLSVMRPFYTPAWEHENSTITSENKSKLLKIKLVVKLLIRNQWLFNIIRNLGLIVGLVTGSSNYSINNPRFTKIKVNELIRGSV